MKNIGIVADNYKVARFEKELNSAGYAVEKTAAPKETTLMKVWCSNDEYETVKKKIHSICIKVEAHFKRSN